MAINIYLFLFNISRNINLQGLYPYIIYCTDTIILPIGYVKFLIMLYELYIVHYTLQCKKRTEFTRSIPGMYNLA